MTRLNKAIGRGNEFDLPE
jgi:hypothetical protein